MAEKVIVTVSGGVAEVAYRPRKVEVIIVNFDHLREEANTDRRIRALGILGEQVERVARRGTLHVHDNMESIAAVNDWLMGNGPMPSAEVLARRY